MINNMKLDKYRRYIFTLSWFSITLIIGVLIFTNGLLLHREELPYKSSCAVIFNNTDNFNNSHPLSNIEHQRCLSSNFKVILIIIDALRYDFVEHHNISSEKLLPYQNQLTVIHRLLKTHPKNSKLLKFVADPPTTTMQRIKGFTTGSLSTFIDISSNFDTPEINEDNLIDILNQANKKAVFMGDDTWLKLYPDRFLRSYPFDSFNVWDLDTVDNGVRDSLFPELSNSDWDLLIGHFLGVDHCGHRFGPNHVEMKRKLEEMNDVLEKIVVKIEDNDDTLLFVMGDHGMTSTGDHGGETENEVTSALFVYSPVHRLYQTKTDQRSVNQVDIVPTLSSILGLSIPFSNLGSVILDCIPSKILNSFVIVSFLLSRNAEQMTNYILEYSRANHQFTSHQLKSILNEYSMLKNSSDVDILSYKRYMKNVLNTCQQVWVRFNVTSIFLGLFCIGVVSMFCFIFSEYKIIQNAETFYKFAVIYAIAAVILGIIGVKLCFVDAITSFMVSVELCSVFYMSWLCFRFKFFINFRCIFAPKFIDLGVVFLYGLLLAVPFSNSFILEQPKIVLFLFVTLLWLVTLTSGSSGFRVFNLYELLTTRLAALAAVISVIFRIVLKFAKCREEEDYQCRIAESENVTDFSCALAVGLFVVMFIYFIICRERNFVVLVAGLLPLYWIGEVTMSGNSNAFVLVNVIPAFVLVVSFISFCVTIYNPMSSSSQSLSGVKRPVVGLLVFVAVVANVILGQLYTIPALLMSIGIWCMAYYIHVVGSCTSWKFVMLWGLSSIYWFYATGHNTSFSSIQWNAAFLLQREMNSMLLPGLLVGLHTFMAFIMHSISLGIVTIVPYMEHKSKFRLSKRKVYEDTFILILKYFTFFSFRMFSTMLAVYCHSRHLMMWGVFAPEFIFQGIAFIITLIISNVGFILMMRIVGKCRAK